MVATILTILAGLMQALPRILDELDAWRLRREQAALADALKGDLNGFDNALAATDALALARSFDAISRKLPDGNP